MKRFLSISLLVSVGLNLYLLNGEFIFRDDFSEDTNEFAPQETVGDQVKLAQAALKKESCECKKPALVRRKRKVLKKAQKDIFEQKVAQEKEISEDEMREKMEASYQAWMDKSENFFIEDLHLNAEQIAAYRELSARREAEISNYFTQKTKERGNPAAYLFTSEDTIFMGRLAEKYEGQLKEVFGEENYKKHKSFISKHNGSAMADEFVQVVEF